MLMFLITSGCIKETYNMKKLSDKMHFSPTLAMAVATGDITLSDIVKSNDTVVFDQNNFVKIIFKEDSVINLRLSDFFPAIKPVELSGADQTPRNLKFSGQVVDDTKAPGDLIATLEPDTLDLGIEDVLSKITGTFSIINPSITVTYTNSFAYPIRLNLNVKGKRETSTLDLNLNPFTIIPTGSTGTASLKIDSTNSALPALVSMPPEKIFSGTAMVNLTGKNGTMDPYVLGSNRFIGSLEVEVPLELRIKSLQLNDTVDNFLQTKNNDNSSFKPEDIDSLQINIVANNGFPIDISLKMILYDPVNKANVKTIDASSLLSAAPVDANENVTGKTESTTKIKISKDFFSAVNSANKIIFSFTLNTTGNGSKNVKIYSDYSISFTASVIVKPNINL